jgi:plasmid maintenance system antidote protein VapI
MNILDNIISEVNNLKSNSQVKSYKEFLNLLKEGDFKKIDEFIENNKDLPKDIIREMGNYFKQEPGTDEYKNFFQNSYELSEKSSKSNMPKLNHEVNIKYSDQQYENIIKTLLNKNFVFDIEIIKHVLTKASEILYKKNQNVIEYVSKDLSFEDIVVIGDLHGNVDDLNSILNSHKENNYVLKVSY